VVVWRDGKAWFGRLPNGCMGRGNHESACPMSRAMGKRNGTTKRRSPVDKSLEFLRSTKIMFTFVARLARISPLSISISIPDRDHVEWYNITYPFHISIRIAHFPLCNHIHSYVWLFGRLHFFGFFPFWFLQWKFEDEETLISWLSFEYSRWIFKLWAFGFVGIDDAELKLN